MLRPALTTLPLAVAVLTATPLAFAAAGAKLTYVRGPGTEQCPSEGEFRRLVADRVGYDVFFPWAQRTVVVEISVAKVRGRHGSVQIVDDRGLLVGQRTLDSKSQDCADLARALALAISIAVDDRSLEYIPPPQVGSPPPTTNLETDAPSSAEPRSDSPPPVAPPSAIPTADDSIHPSAWLMPTASSGVAPKASLGSEAALSARYRRVSLGLEVRVDLPASVALQQGGSVSTWLVLVSVVPCLNGARPLAVCAIGGVGSFAESGRDFASPRPPRSVPLWTAGGRLSIQTPLAGDVFFVANADVLGVFTRYEVSVDSAPVFKVAPVSFVVGAGIGLRL